MKLSEIRGLSLQPFNGGLGAIVSKPPFKKATKTGDAYVPSNPEVGVTDKGLFFTAIPGLGGANDAPEDKQAEYAASYMAKHAAAKNVTNKKPSMEGWTPWNPSSRRPRPEGDHWVMFRNGEVHQSVPSKGGRSYSWNIQGSSNFDIVAYRPYIDKIAPGARVKVLPHKQAYHERTRPTGMTGSVGFLVKGSLDDIVGIEGWNREIHESCIELILS